MGGQQTIAEAVVDVRRVGIIRDVLAEDPDGDVRHLEALEHGVTEIVHLALRHLLRKSEVAGAAGVALFRLGDRFDDRRRVGGGTERHHRRPRQRHGGKHETQPVNEARLRR